MKSFALGGLSLALAFAAGLGLAHADDNGLPGQPIGGGSTTAGSNTNPGGGTAANPGGTGTNTGGTGTNTGGTGTNTGGTAPGGTAPNGQPTQPPATRLSPVVENAVGKRTVADRLKGVARDAFDPTQSGSFIGGIAVSDLATAGWNGIRGDPTAIDQAGDLGHALTTPEFYAGVGMFNLVYARGDKLVGKLGADYMAKAAADESAGFATKALGAGAGFLKENVVLAAALTIPRLVQFDFGGFNLWSATKDTGKGIWNSITSVGGDLFHQRWGDIGHDLGQAWSPFGHEFAQLKNFKVSSSFKFDKQHFEDLGITLGSFILAKPLWAGIKMLGKGLIKKFLVRQATAATIEGGEILAGGGPEDPIGDAAAVVTEAGLLAWTLWDVGVAAVDLGGLLLTANAIQKPFQGWNDNRQFEDAAKTAEQNYINVTKENGGNPDPKKLQDAMAQLATAMADLRDYHYLPVAIEDAKYVDRLKRLGVTQAEIDGVAKKVMNDDGAWLAAPGQSAALEAAFAPGTKHPGVTDQAAFDDLAKRHAEEMANLMKGLDAQARLDATHLDPANKDFGWSQNRDQLYDEEIAILARGGSNLTNQDLQGKVLQDMQIVGGLATAEQQLLAPVHPKTPGINAALNTAGGGN